MQTKLAWPEARPTPRARFRSDLDLYPPLDRLGLFEAAKLRERLEAIQDSATTGTWTELMFQNRADGNAFNNSAAEGSLLGGLNDQPTIPALFFFNKQGIFRTLLLEAEGTLVTASTPTIIFQVRFGTTSGSSFLSGTSVGVSATITCATLSTATNWMLRLKLYCQVAGIGTNNTTLSGAGWVQSGGFNSPFIYPLAPTTPPTGTWTSTIDNSVTQYVNLSVTWGTMSASNSITLKSLTMAGLN